jgi:hypothetical protein
LDAVTITSELLVVDPQGRQVQVTQHLCPAQSDPAAACAASEQSPAWRPLSTERATTRRALQSLGGEVDGLSQQWILSAAALEETLALVRQRAPVEWLGTNVTLVVHAAVVGSSEEEVAIKRFPLSLNMLRWSWVSSLHSTQQHQVEDALGIPWCDQETAIAAMGNATTCFIPRQPNHNPHVTRMLFGPAADDALAVTQDQLGVHVSGPDDNDLDSGGTFHDVTTPLVVTAGSAVALRPLMLDATHESFQNVELDQRTGAFSMLPTREDMAYAWFTTAGSINHVTSDRGRMAGSGLADAHLRIPADTPPGPAFVWMVARDQRGGVDWWRVDLQVVAQ